jgi:uncharacterized glyoxalase superfamily protein PhnB
MLANRSVPTDTVLPHVTYKNLPEAIRWLTGTLGFVEDYRYGDPVSGAQIHLGGAIIQVNQARGDYRSPAELGFGTQSLTVFVENVEEHFARARAAGVLLVEELHETAYGELQYALRDLEGHLWLFSRHVRDLSPETWGATPAGEAK